MKRSTDKILSDSHAKGDCLSQKSNNLLAFALHANSNLKIPTMKQLIEEWKHSAASHSRTDDSILAATGDIDEIHEYIQYLTSRIASLEASLGELVKRHMEVCLVLQTEVQKRETKNDTLLRENHDLRKELLDMIGQVRTIATQFCPRNKEKREGKRLGTQSNKNRFAFKESQAAEIASEFKELHVNTKGNIAQSKSLPRTELSKMRLKTASSLLRLKQDSRSRDRKERRKLCHIKEEYYYKSDHRMKQNNPSKSIYRSNE